MRRPCAPKDCQRIWGEARPNLGRETTESGARGADKLRERGAEDYLTLQR